MEIRNECAALPRATLWHVRQSLRWIYPADLPGLSCIRLIDKTPTDVILRLKGCRSANKTSTALGFYMPRYKERQPYIALNVPKIIRGVPRMFLWTTIPTLLFARVLAHEVGHHLIAQRGYAAHPTERPRQRHNEYEEEMVERYAFEVVKKMNERAHYKLGRWLGERLANLYYETGVVDWHKENFKLASAWFLKAYSLNPELEDAWVFYWQAKHKADAQIKDKDLVKA